MNELGTALPALLKPVGATSQTGSGTKPAVTAAGSKPPSESAVAIKDLQQLLLQDGDYQGPTDGVYSPETKAAYQKYLTKHPSSSVQPNQVARRSPNLDND